MTDTRRHIAIIGAGLAGSLLAILLARRGWDVDVYEKRGDPRVAGYAGGRSINLALAERGRHALALAGADEAVMRHAVMMRGRMVHFLDGRTDLQRYGRDDSEVIWSVHRGELNIVLLDIAEAAGVRLHFDRGLDGVDFEHRVARFAGPDGHAFEAEFDALVGADGAGSALRAAMSRVADLGERVENLGHGYKELEIPPAADGGFRIEPNALHIWPRGRYMCIALPNDERTFTVTLFLPSHGEPSFDTIRDGAQARAFFDLPEAGRELATLVRGQLRGFEDFLKSRSDELVEVQVGAGDSLLTWLLIPRLETFQREFPRVQVKICNLRSSEIIQRTCHRVMPTARSMPSSRVRS